MLNRLICCLILLYLPGRDYNHIYGLDYFKRGFCRNLSVPCSYSCSCPLHAPRWPSLAGGISSALLTLSRAVISILVMIFAGHYTFKQLSSGRNPKKKMRKKNKHSFDLNKCLCKCVCECVCVCDCVVWCPTETNENCGRGRVSRSQGNGGAGAAADPNESHDSWNQTKHTLRCC